MEVRSGMSARPRRVLLAAILVLGLGAAATPVTVAADSPEDAVRALFERYGSGDFSDIDTLVCEEQREAMRSQLAEMTGLGLDAGALRIEVRDPELTVISEDGDTALVRVVATMAFQIDESALREMARQSIVDMGDEPTDEAIDSMVGMMGGFVGQETPMDEEMPVVRRDGQWLVCPDLDDGGSGTNGSSGVTSNLSDAGICGVVPIDQLNAISPATFDYSFGSTDQCNWSASGSDPSVSLSVNLARGQTLESYRWGEFEELTVADRPAVAMAPQLYVELDEGVLTLSAWASDASGNEVDLADFPVRAAELIIPGLGDLPGNPLGDCGVIDIAELNALRPVGLSPTQGFYGSCTFEANHSLSVSFDLTGTLESYTGWMEGQELEVAGHPAFQTQDSLWVQLDDGLLTVTARSGYSGEPDPEVDAWMVAVAGYVIERLADG